MLRNLGRRGGMTALVMTLLAGLAACGGVGGSVSAPPPSLGTVVNFPVPPSIADIPLTKPDGTTTTLGAYRGRTVMIADFLSLCTDICPLISANTAVLTRALNADGQQSNVALLEISVDPQRDTPARLAAYQKLYGQIPPNWTLLSASAANTKAIWKFFHVSYQRVKEPQPASTDWLTHKKLTYDVDHDDDVFFLGPTGRERFIINGDPDTQGSSSTPSKLVQFLDSQGLNSLYHPNAVGDWTVQQGLDVFGWLLDQKLTVPS